MKNFIIRLLGLLGLVFLCNYFALSQNSLLVNFGSEKCEYGSPGFSFIKNPLGVNPTVLSSCTMANQLPDFYNVFIAYNPKDGKIYIADIRTGLATDIWKLDMGLPTRIACPDNIPVAPNYSYPYVSNNFEFDNNGDLWSFSTYNRNTGKCSMDKFDVSTGTVINSRELQFPVGNFPTAITSGDLCILPNGRMFATLGSNPSQLYEINNYNTSTGATATYLQTLPDNCFGIAYLNGQLELTGFSNSCYYFDYDISTNTLGEKKAFQNGELPIDNTSITPAIGTTKQLLNATQITPNTADLTYEIYVQNMGNVILDNIDVMEDLGTVFGLENVSNVSASFVEGANVAGLVLNPLYNGTTVTGLLASNQKLPNQTFANTDHYFKIQVKCRVTNLKANVTYWNSSIGKATINNAVDIINITDSSNNGTSAVVDPNNDGNASGIGENEPTPFDITMLPVHFLSIDAALKNRNTALVTWSVATPVDNAARFEIEFSSNGVTWSTVANIPITDFTLGKYQYTHNDILPGNLFYRVKQIDLDGAFTYSKVVLLNNNAGDKNYIVYPNPANNYLRISTPYNSTGNTTIELYDAVGKKIISSSIFSNSTEINTSALPYGTYLLKLIQNNEIQIKKILIKH
jgi:hypothetical protein